LLVGTKEIHIGSRARPIDRTGFTGPERAVPRRHETTAARSVENRQIVHAEKFGQTPDRAFRMGEQIFETDEEVPSMRIAQNTFAVGDPIPSGEIRKRPSQCAE
jgi:hypothetical protein